MDIDDICGVIVFLMFVLIVFILGYLASGRERTANIYHAQVNAISIRPDGNYDITIQRDKNTTTYTCAPHTALSVKVGSTHKFKEFRHEELYLLEGK